MKKAIIIWGGWDGHEPKETSEIAKDILVSLGYDVVLTEDKDILLTDDVKTADLIVPCMTCDKLTPEQSEALRGIILSGCGLAGWHGGMGDAFREDSAYQFMVGGQFVDHPGGCIDYTVNIVSEDPIVAGIKDFQMKSECYYMHVDPSNDVLATTTFTNDHCDWIGGTVMPVVWKRSYGKGKVFYSSLGHVSSDFSTEVKEILKRGMVWATK